MTRSRLLPAAISMTALLVSACSGAPAPVDVTGAEMCAMCRMAVSDPRFAGQIVAPGEEPRFFDDIGCLARAVKAAAPPAGAVAFVADHRTGEWVRASEAIYTRASGVSTPMGSGILAHATAASRDADAAARGGEPLTAADVFGAGAPAGDRDGA